MNHNHAISRRAVIAGAAVFGAAAALPGCTVPLAHEGSAAVPLVDQLARRTFEWFLHVVDEKTGLVPDRWPTPSFASIAAVGFALTVWPVGMDAGWISRDDAAGLVLRTLRTFAAAPMGPGANGIAGHRGFFYHFLDMETGTRFGRTELSSIDTTLLLGGVLYAAERFDRDTPMEREIRALAKQLYEAVEWDWMLGQGPYVGMGWHPETGFIPSQWQQYDESMLLYVLAIASPTHPIPAAIWPRLAQRFDRQWGAPWGEPHVHFPPLFGHQYSQIWLDMRNIRDAYIASKNIDYFENSWRAAHGQRAYAIANPLRHAGYGPDIWGLTACDGPGDFTVEGRTYLGYSARGPGQRDDGTLAPTAAAGMLPFAPDIVEPCLEALVARYGPGIWTAYGFLDSFNPGLTKAPPNGLQKGSIDAQAGWVDSDYLGIDQGPIVAMHANYRSEGVWKAMRRSPIIVTGLKRMGFNGGWLDKA